MLTIEQRAHDMTIAILAKVMTDENLSCFSPDGKKIETFEVTDLYCTLYESFLRDLQECGEL